MKIINAEVFIYRTNQDGTGINVEQRPILTCGHCRYWRKIIEHSGFCEIGYNPEVRFDNDFCSRCEKKDNQGGRL